MKGIIIEIIDGNDKRVERMGEKEDNCFVRKGRGQKGLPILFVAVKGASHFVLAKNRGVV